MRYPSFQQYWDRIQVIRVGTAVVSFLIVAGMSRWLGSQWDSALIHGIGTAVVMYFISWLAALTIFAEMYQVDVARAEEAMRREEQDRLAELRALTDRRQHPGPQSTGAPAQQPPDYGAEAA